MAMLVEVGVDFTAGVSDVVRAEAGAEAGAAADAPCNSSEPRARLSPTNLSSEYQITHEMARNCRTDGLVALFLK